MSLYVERLELYLANFKHLRKFGFPLLPLSASLLLLPPLLFQLVLLLTYPTNSLRPYFITSPSVKFQSNHSEGVTSRTSFWVWNVTDSIAAAPPEPGKPICAPRDSQAFQGAQKHLCNSMGYRWNAWEERVESQRKKLEI